MMNFIDKGSDLNTLDYLSKSMNSETLEKALNHTGLVQKEVQYRTSTGKMAMRKQWVRANEAQPVGTNKPQKQSNKETEKRPQVPATPHNITDKTKHLVAVNSAADVSKDIIKAIGKPVPPTWRNIMVSPDPKADLLVIGKDDQDRTQYIYSSEFTTKTKAEKFERVQSLMENKNKIAQIIQSLDNSETSDCLNLIFQMGIRPGSTQDTKAKTQAYGATTLKGSNVVIENGEVYLRFIGKKGVEQDHLVPSNTLGKMLIDRKEKSGDDGDLFNTNATNLRKALKPFGIHPKDLRTLLATSTAQEMLKNIPPTSDPNEFAKIRNQVGEKVCELLGNRREESLRSYIDPSVFEQWSADGVKNWKNSEGKKQKAKEIA